jgi:hypothetical protein
MLAMLLPWQLGHGVMSMLCHASNVAAVAIWPWHDVDVDDHANVTFGQISM